MKLSEAISLGHTLIGEDSDVFYDPRAATPCGCAIGSAYAAVGGRTALVDGVRWLERHWPWTKQDATGRLLARLRIRDALAVSETISCLHHYFEIPRLEIAKMVAEIEPQGPEGDYVPDAPARTRDIAHKIVEEAVEAALAE